MLTELHIKDFAIIEELHIQFGHGLIIFTGETGAGKSIILDAVEAIIGGRVDSSLIRANTDSAYIEGHFSIHETLNLIRSILQREELELDSDFLILSREIKLNGRNIARVNGKVVALGVLKEIGEILIDLHGQSEHLSLLRYSEHLPLLDRYANTTSLLATYQTVYQSYKHNIQTLKKMRKEKENYLRRFDLLTFQIQEIQSANLKVGEDKELKIERDRLANAEGIASIIQEVLQFLDEGYQDTPSIIDLMGQVVHALSKLNRIDPSKAQLYNESETIFDNLNDLSKNVRMYFEDIEFNPKRLTQTEERLELIHNLQKKYGKSIEETLTHAEKISSELEKMAHTEEQTIELKEQIQRNIQQLLEVGNELSSNRKSSALALAQKVQSELDELKMSGALFEVAFRSYKKEQIDKSDGEDFDIRFGENGFEEVEFLIAPNPGEGLKPLIKIASGGETSRIMLALKNVLANVDQVPTLIFDEIDQGIGGRVGSIVGKKIWELGKKHQVMCITHLPQLAAYGDQHFQVQKTIIDGRTLTNLNQLAGEERIIELAQMLGEVSDGTLRSAFELLQAANQTTSKKTNAEYHL